MEERDETLASASSEAWKGWGALEWGEFFSESPSVASRRTESLFEAAGSGAETARKMAAAAPKWRLAALALRDPLWRSIPSPDMEADNSGFDERFAKEREALRILGLCRALRHTKIAGGAMAWKGGCKILEVGPPSGHASFSFWRSLPPGLAEAAQAAGLGEELRALAPESFARDERLWLATHCAVAAGLALAGAAAWYFGSWIGCAAAWALGLATLHPDASAATKRPFSAARAKKIEARFGGPEKMDKLAAEAAEAVLATEAPEALAHEGGIDSDAARRTLSRIRKRARERATEDWAQLNAFGEEAEFWEAGAPASSQSAGRPDRGRL